MGTWSGTPGKDFLKIVNRLGSLFTALIVQQEEPTKPIQEFQNIGGTVATVNYDGTISGVTPTVSAHLATKAYVDGVSGGGAHAVNHQAGGSDPIALDTLAATTDVATLNASTTAHGLLRKLDNVTTNFLRGDGAWAAPAGASSSWQMHASSETLAAPATTKTFSSLTGDANRMYFLVVRTIFNVNSTVVGLRFNADTGNNYGSQDVIGTTATAGAAQETVVARIPLQFSGATASGRSALTTAWIHPTSGFKRLVNMQTNNDAGNGTVVVTHASRTGIWTNTADQITSLTVYSDQTNGLHTGTRIELWVIG